MAMAHSLMASTAAMAPTNGGGRFLDNKLVRSLGAMGASEMCNRVTRVLTAIALAHTLSPKEFGLAAVTLTTWELTRVLTSTGLDARIMQCTDEQLESVCRSSYSLNWWLHGVVCLLQIAAAFPVAYAYGDTRIAYLLLGLAVPYLAFPWAAVQVCRLQREQRTGLTATMLAMLISGDNLLSATMAMAGCGLWSIALPKMAMSIVWALAYRRLSPWRPVGALDFKSVGTTFRFGAVILATEIVNVLRVQGDKLIIGQFLGLEQLGTYYFAFNAGLGITTGVVGAFSAALLPHFCRTSRLQWSGAEFWRPALTVTLMTAPMVALQAGLAPIYVPLVFGQRWNEAIPLLMVLCVSGASLGLWRALTQFIRSRGKPGLELLVTALYASAGLAAVTATASQGAMAVAVALLVVSLTVVPVLALLTLRHLISTSKVSTP